MKKEIVNDLILIAQHITYEVERAGKKVKPNDLYFGLMEFHEDLKNESKYNLTRTANEIYYLAKLIEPVLEFLNAEITETEFNDKMYNK